jgi:hypothetical protein
VDRRPRHEEESELVSHFRLRWAKLGGHVHVHVWSGTSAATTHGKNGTLVFTEQEWEDFKDLLHDGGDAVVGLEVVPTSQPLDGEVIGDPYTWESGT